MVCIYSKIYVNLNYLNDNIIGTHFIQQKKPKQKTQPNKKPQPNQNPNNFPLSYLNQVLIEVRQQLREELYILKASVHRKLVLHFFQNCLLLVLMNMC